MRFQQENNSLYWKAGVIGSAIKGILKWGEFVAKTDIHIYDPTAMTSFVKSGGSVSWFEEVWRSMFVPCRMCFSCTKPNAIRISTKSNRLLGCEYSRLVTIVVLANRILQTELGARKRFISSALCLKHPCSSRRRHGCLTPMRWSLMWNWLGASFSVLWGRLEICTGTFNGRAASVCPAQRPLLSLYLYLKSLAAWCCVDRMLRIILRNKLFACQMLLKAVNIQGVSKIWLPPAVAQQPLKGFFPRS